MNIKTFIFIIVCAIFPMFVLGCKEGNITISDGNNNTQALEEMNQNIDIASYKGLEDVFSNSAHIKSDSKPIMLVFGKNNCLYCEKLKSDITKDSSLRDFIKENFISYYINTSYSKSHEVVFLDKSMPTDSLAMVYGLDGTPLTIWFEPNGNKILSLQGYDKKYFVSMLHFIQEEKYAQEDNFNKRMELFAKTLQ
ncbi:DUF255 domain-containing protein [Helicobacter muridarum]|uniref:DUF255 domain-containing protein n=1 Tax=Helicobacter muridarum TaxID=216 RepID=A0A099TY50_9HELI|nr:thioredoxin fold domain-containing protein [Helicobacter muridarum]TLE01580.1 DUF255 domain-containing protein [Helicobacter muridarum]STQ86190.1 thiol:disulfide interchange protein DsbC [Helicobacter muridarum]